MLLEDQEKVGIYGIVMMICLLDFNMLSDIWGYSQVEEQFFILMNLLLIFMMCYFGVLLVCYYCSDFVVLLLYWMLKEVESIVGQLIKVVDILLNNKMFDCDDMIYIGICVWCSGQDIEQVMEYVEFVMCNVGLQGGNSWVIYDDLLFEKGCGNVCWCMFIE